MKRPIRNYFLRKLFNTKRVTVYAGWHNVKSVLLLCDEIQGNKNTAILALKELLEKEDKTINMLTFVAHKKPKENAQMDCYYTSDVTFFGRPKITVLQRLSNNVDVLIDWSTGTNSPNDFIAASSTASFKIGINQKLPCFDLEIKDDEQNRTLVIEQIEKYLKLINHE